MIKRAMSATFSELVELVAVESPHGLILDWGQRLERALRYYTVAFHGKRNLTMAQAIAVLGSDSRVSSDVIAALHDLRRKRNTVAHDSRFNVGSDEAASFAYRALELIGRISLLVPDDLALSSGAARVA